MRRVVVTGIGGITALGDNWPAIKTRMLQGHTAVRTMSEWERFSGINTRLAAPVPDFSTQDRYPRKKGRTMGPVSCMAVYATERALSDCGLAGDPIVKNGRTGIAYGSSFGSVGPVIFAA